MSSKLVANPQKDARQLIMTIENALRQGVRHFRKSDNAYLPTVESILVAIRKEGGVKKLLPERRSKGGIILP
jgi:hypothetical protein